MNTKYSILAKRLNRAQDEADAIRRQMVGLDNTKCGLTCAGCGTLLETEGDFARHFTVSKMDEMNNNLNLGSCPNKNKDN